MSDSEEIRRIRGKYRALALEMDERMRRQWAATEARECGCGGVTLVARATGLSRTTIAAGLRDLALPPKKRLAAANRVRRPGAGRSRLLEVDRELFTELENLLEPSTRGDPESPLRWTCKSTRRLANELTQAGHPISPRTVASLLHEDGYSLQANRKTREGTQHPDRNEQFEFLNAQVKRFLTRGQPAILVDTTKKELVGNFKNAGREWRPQGRPKEVRVDDFQDKALSKVIPYGVYDIVNNQRWVSVGIAHDTAQFAVNSIRRWWTTMGRRRFPNARDLLITAEGGGSNNSRCRLWKTSLQWLADDLGLRLVIRHFPGGTRKWNKIEHRLFSFITQNWRGRALVSRQTIVSLIAETTTRAGLVVKAALDTKKYEKGIKVSDEELAAVRIVPHRFHGEWNYSVSPR